MTLNTIYNVEFTNKVTNERIALFVTSVALTKMILNHRVVEIEYIEAKRGMYLDETFKGICIHR